MTLTFQRAVIEYREDVAQVDVRCSNCCGPYTRRFANEFEIRKFVTDESAQRLESLASTLERMQAVSRCSIRCDQQLQNLHLLETELAKFTGAPGEAGRVTRSKIQEKKCCLKASPAWRDNDNCTDILVCQDCPACLEGRAPMDPEGLLAKMESSLSQASSSRETSITAKFL